MAPQFRPMKQDPPANRKKPGPKPTGRRGSVERFYCDQDAKGTLDFWTEKLGMKASNMICGLIRAAGAYKLPRKTEEPIYAHLMNVTEITYFDTFKQAVAEAIPKLATAHPEDSSFESACDFWTMGKVGIFVCYNPILESVGRILVNAFNLKQKYRLEHVLVTFPFAGMDPLEELCINMEKTGVTVVAITKFKKILAKRKRKPRAKKFEKEAPM